MRSPLMHRFLGGNGLVAVLAAFIGIAAIAQTAAPGGAPVNVLLTPNTGQQGQTLNVMAQGLPCSPRLRLSFLPEGLAVSNLQCAGGGRAGNVAGATFTLAISPNAQLGAYTLVANDGRQTQRFPGAFIVLPGVPPQGPPPRVDRVTPQDLEPGKTYTLMIYGFAFSQGTTIDFGPDVQNMGPPVILDTQRAQLTVLVSPSALEGVRLAQARNTSGQGNKGPGGIRVVPAQKSAPVISPVTGIKAPVQVIKPHGLSWGDGEVDDPSGALFQVDFQPRLWQAWRWRRGWIISWNF